MLRATRTFQKISGLEFLRNRFYNKGTAFTLPERAALEIEGRLPPCVETMQEQLSRCESQFRLLDRPINRYQMLRTFQETNNSLYYALVTKNLTETLPIIYTPTVGEACQKFGSLYTRDHGIYVSQRDRGNVQNLLKNALRHKVEVIVVTDGSRILGLGDLGTNGMGIPIGKCSLYVAGAGIDPRRVLPVMLDVGTNNEALINDPLYLGLRQKRCSNEDFYGLLDEFMAAAKDIFPQAVVQFEDFSSNHCFDMLARYRDKQLCFNDDIQGTGAVVSAGVVNAIRLSQMPFEDHRIVVLGAGSAAVGVVDAISRLLQHRFKVSHDDVAKRVYLVDTRGAVTTTRGDTLAPHKVGWARRDIAAEDNHKYGSLLKTVQTVKPTILIGLAGTEGRPFTEEMVRVMTEATKRPIIFPLSNPTSKAEVDPADVYRWTDGSAIIASGSPFPATTFNGRTLKPSQGNNMYIFPGIGLGAVMAQPTRITDTVLTTAANALVDTVTESMLAESLLYPPLTDIREVSANVAAAVVRQSQIEGLATVAQPANMPELIRAAKAAMWKPEYKPAEFYYTQIAAKGGLTHTASSSTPAPAAAAAAPITAAAVEKSAVKKLKKQKKQKKFAVSKKKAMKNKK